MHTVASGQHQHSLRAIHGVASGDLLAAWLQEVLFGRLSHAVGCLEDREDGTNRDIDVDIAGAIERIEHQQIFALGITVGDRVNGFHFLGCHAGQMAAPFVGFQQDFIGNHIQLLLYLALHVFTTGAAQHFTQRALADRMADALAGPADDFDQQAQLGGNLVMQALLLDQMLGKTDAFAHDALSFSDSQTIFLIQFS